MPLSRVKPKEKPHVYLKVVETHVYIYIYIKKKAKNKVNHFTLTATTKWRSVNSSLSMVHSRINEINKLAKTKLNINLNLYTEYISNFFLFV